MNADSEIFILRVQLATCRIGNLSRLIHILAICVTIHTYILRDEAVENVISRDHIYFQAQDQLFLILSVNLTMIRVGNHTTS